jgi:hypothetical protein
MAGIYIHFPFCKQACTYCNFHFSTSLKITGEACIGFYIDGRIYFADLNQGSSSVNTYNNHEIHVNKNWHYCWSKFYYFKKNYGYLYGLKKTIPNFVRAMKKYFF